SMPPRLNPKVSTHVASSLFSGAKRRKEVAPLVRAGTRKSKVPRREAPARRSVNESTSETNDLSSAGKCRAFGARNRLVCLLRPHVRSYYLAPLRGSRHV